VVGPTAWTAWLVAAYIVTHHGAYNLCKFWAKQKRLILSSVLGIAALVFFFLDEVFDHAHSVWHILIFSALYTVVPFVHPHNENFFKKFLVLVGTPDTSDSTSTPL
jgi:hypothetical protein